MEEILEGRSQHLAWPHVLSLTSERSWSHLWHHKGQTSCLDQREGRPSSITILLLCLCVCLSVSLFRERVRWGGGTWWQLSLSGDSKRTVGISSSAYWESHNPITSPQASLGPSVISADTTQLLGWRAEGGCAWVHARVHVWVHMWVRACVCECVCVSEGERNPLIKHYICLWILQHNYSD